MCGICGCDEAAIEGKDAGYGHEHGQVTLEQRVLGRNDAIAAGNRAALRAHGIVALNLMSSPGAGKTRLLERTVAEFAGTPPVRVIGGDQATAHDAERIARAGGQAIQINTGASCHLNAEMLRGAVATLPGPCLLLIENVGNLVCPSLFDLGEHERVVIASTTEGDDKPLKYPYMYRAADLVLLNKIDLLPHVDFSRQLFRDALAQVNPGAPVIELSARTGEGLAQWYAWLNETSARSVA